MGTTTYFMSTNTESSALEQVYPVCYASLTESGYLYSGLLLGFPKHTATSSRDLSIIEAINPKVVEEWGDLGELGVAVVRALARYAGCTEVTSEYTRGLSEYVFNLPTEEQAYVAGNAYTLVAMLHAARTVKGSQALSAFTLLYLTATGVDQSKWLSTIDSFPVEVLFGLVTWSSKILFAFSPSGEMYVDYLPTGRDTGFIFSENSMDYPDQFKKVVREAVTTVPDFFPGQEDGDDMFYDMTTYCGFECSMPYYGDVVYVQHCPITGNKVSRDDYQPPKFLIGNIPGMIFPHHKFFGAECMYSREQSHELCLKLMEVFSNCWEQDHED